MYDVKEGKKAREENISFSEKFTHHRNPMNHEKDKNFSWNFYLASATDDGERKSLQDVDRETKEEENE
jgi:uncharacterized protein YydD (DUF2326 family)